MLPKLCGNYVLEIELLPVPGTATQLRVPVRRCLLSEHLFSQLMLTEAGRDVVRKLILGSSQLPDHKWRELEELFVPGRGGEDIALERDENVTVEEVAVIEARALLRAALGPDLEPIHDSQCFQTRCNQSCTPGYRRLLEQFGDPDRYTENSPGCPDPPIFVEEFEESGLREF